MWHHRRYICATFCTESSNANIKYLLVNFGISSKILHIITNMYSKVKTNEECDTLFKLNKGVMQGECLYPSLFAMYINDIEHIIYMPLLFSIYMENLF